MTIEWAWVVGPIISGLVVLIGAVPLLKRHLTVDFPRLSGNVDKLGQAVTKLTSAVEVLSSKADGHEYRLRRLEDRS